MGIRGLAKSFQYAAAGFWHCVQHERNFRIHLVAGACALLLAGYLALPKTEMALLLLTIGGVLTLEMLNTAMETFVDLASAAMHPLAKRAKDVAAGAVLVASAVSVAVGICLLWKPKQLYRLWMQTVADPIKIAVLLLAVLLALLFIFGARKKQDREKNWENK